MITAKKLPLIITLLFSIGVLSACGSSSSDSDPETPPAANGNGSGDAPEDDPETNGNGEGDSNGDGDGDGGPATPTAWEWVHPLPQGFNLNAVIADSTQFIAAGDRGTLLTSANGEVWTTQTIGDADIAALVYNGSRYVAVGGVGNNNNIGGNIFYSDDGTEWTRVEPDFSTGRLNAVTWTGNEFVAMGNEFGTVLRSENGDTWKKTETGPEIRVISLAADNSTVIAGGTNALYRSADGGGTWTRQINYQSMANSSFNGLLYDGSQFVAVGPNNMYGLTYSEDGTSWSNRTEDFQYAFNSNPQRNFNDVIRVDDHYWVINRVGFVHRREVGGEEAWSTQSERTTNPLSSIAHLDDVYMAVGDNGQLYRSTNGDTWSDQRTLAFTLQGSDSLEAVAANDDRLVIVGNRTIIVTTDGEEWTRLELDQNYSLQDVMWTGTRFVAAGTNVVGHSLNGLDWTFDTDVQGGFSVITGAGDQWAAVNGSSFQGDQLALCTPAGCDEKEAPFSNIRSIARVGDVYILANHSGYVSTSTNLEDWSELERPFTTSASLLASSGDVAVLTTPTDTRDNALYTTDGETWEPISFPAGTSVGSTRLVLDGEYFRLFGNNDNSLLSSADGASWTHEPMTPLLRDMAPLGDQFFMINDSNHILKR